MSMEYLIIPSQSIFYLQICTIALIVVGVCRVIEFAQSMRIKAVELDKARIERETAAYQRQLVLAAIMERQNRKA